MASELANEAYENLTISMRDEDGVTVEPDGLRVHGRVFAFRQGDDLVVELPIDRANDLVARGVAHRAPAEGRDWVRVSDLQLWPELAGEAHEFVGEPAVGGDS
ncbi:MAG: hypothetical protein ABJB03_06530 [Rhodoglobus sp.]